MKRLFKSVIGAVVVLAMVVSLSACGEEGSSGNKIPDVFGVNYTDAISILEADGYEVTSIEISVDGVAEKLLYGLGNVAKGTVIKIDDYVLDGNGNLNKNYDILWDEEPVSEDMSVVIYYAKEDYVAEKEGEDEVEDETTSTTISSTKATTTTTTKAKTDKDTSNEGISADFKAAMDSYEEFMDEYVAFMKKYSDNPSDLGLLADYADYMSKYADFVEDFEKWENEDMNTAELAYYIEVQARVSKKLLEVAY